MPRKKPQKEYRKLSAQDITARKIEWDRALSGPVLLRLMEFATVTDMIALTQVCQKWCKTAAISQVFLRHFKRNFPQFRHGVVLHLNGEDVLKDVDGIASTAHSSIHNPRFRYELALWTSVKPLYDILPQHRMPLFSEGCITIVRAKERAQLANIGQFGLTVLSLVFRESYYYATIANYQYVRRDVVKDILRCENRDIGVAFAKAVREIAALPQTGSTVAKTTAEIEWMSRSCYSPGETSPDWMHRSAEQEKLRTNPVWTRHQDVVDYLYPQVTGTFEDVELVHTILLGKQTFMVLAFEPPLQLGLYTPKLRMYSQRPRKETAFEGLEELCDGDATRMDAIAFFHAFASRPLK